MMSILSERQIMSFNTAIRPDNNLKMINDLKKYKLNKIQTQVKFDRNASYFDKLKMINKMKKKDK